MKTSLDKLNPVYLIQISLDGPHIKWKILEELVKEREISDPEIPQFINMGSCGLHLVHGAFTTGATATGWHIDNLLKSKWFVFSDSLAKRENYMKVLTT